SPSPGRSGPKLCGLERRGPLPAIAVSSSWLLPATAGTVKTLLQNVLFHKRGNKPSHAPARADRLSYVVRGDGHVDAPKDVQGTASQSNRVRPSRTTPYSPPH